MLIILSFIIIFGLLISFEDLKKGKIRNIYIFIGIVSGLIFLLINPSYMKIPGYFQIFLINSGFALFIGFLLWFFNFWSAGDGKLFFAYSTLIPLGIYFYGYTSFFPSQTILINTFVPVFIFMFFKSLIKTKRREKVEVIKKMFNPSLLIQISLGVFCFSWIFRIIFSLIHIPSNYFLNILLIFFLFELLERTPKLDLTKVLGVIAIFRIIFDYGNIMTLPFLYKFLFMLAIFLFLRYFILYLGFYTYSTPVKINELKPKMILVETLQPIPKEGRYDKLELIYISLIELFRKDVAFITFKQIAPYEEMKKMKFIDPKNINHKFSNFVKDGLSSEDVEYLKKLQQEKKLNFKTLRIRQRTFFAPFLFFGVLLTFLFHGNFLISLKANLSFFIQQVSFPL